MVLAHLYIRTTDPYLFNLENLHYLINMGAAVTVEEGHPFNPQDIQTLRIKEELKGRWLDQPHDTIVLGTTEMEEGEEPLTQRHVCFSSLFNNDLPPSNLLLRLFWGNGRLFDLSYITNYSLDNLQNPVTQTLITQELTAYIRNDPSDQWKSAEYAFIDIITNYTPS